MKDYLGFFPDAPVMTDEERLDLHRRYRKQYIFYKKHGKHADCYCTSCMRRFTLSDDMPTDAPFETEAHYLFGKLKHNENAWCPYCGADVTVKAEGIKRAGLYEACHISRIYHSNSGNTVWIVSGTLCGGYDDQSHTVEILEKNYDGPGWYPRNVVKLTRGSAEMANRCYYWDEWYKRNNERDFWEPVAEKGGMFYSTEHFTMDNIEALNDTFLKYIFPFTGRFSHKIKFLQFAAVYPTVEMLCKAGGTELIKSIVDYNYTYKRVLNLNGRTAAEVFRTDGNTAARIKLRMAESKVGTELLKCWRALKKQGYSFDDAADLWALSWNYKRSVEIMEKTGLSLRKYINYINKQADMRVCKSHAMAQSYADYIRECEELGYDIRSSMINRPRDLDAAHQRTMSAVRAIKAEALAREEEAQNRKYLKEIYHEYVQRYEYTDGEFSIIVPKSALDIVREGAAMDHCVAGYAERHCKGVLAILFLRKNDDLAKSLYTIEMHGDRLTQIQGYHNCTPLTPEAKKFFDKWLKWQALPEARKHPKRNRKKSA